MILTRKALWIAGIIMLLTVHDVLTTYILLLDGGQEVNPVAVAIIENLGLEMGLFVFAPLFKLANLALAICLLAYAEKKCSSRDWLPKTCFVLMVIGAIICALPVVNNYYQLLKHYQIL